MLSGIKHDQTEADFSHQSLLPVDCILIASDLMVSAVLTTLVIAENRIGPVGAKAFADALRVNAVLTSLDLSDNELGGTIFSPDLSGISALAKALKVNRDMMEATEIMETEVWLISQPYRPEFLVHSEAYKSNLE